MRSTFLIVLLVVWCSVASGLADMGSIPFKSGVRVFEPEQQALIAWNGNQEVMLLATQLRASEKSKVLEVMPLPSRPAVTEGEYRSLVLANNLIQWKTGRHPSDSGDGSDPFAAAIPEILTHEPIREDQFEGWPRAKIKMPIRAVKLFSREVSAIDKTLGVLLGNDRMALLRTWEIRGALSGFDRDLLVGGPIPKQAPSGK